MPPDHVRRSWTFPGFHYEPGDRPLIMGIVNVTPDSFSDGGKYHPVDLAVEHAMQLVSEGADILDIGGESTRPGAEPVSLDDGSAAAGRRLLAPGRRPGLHGNLEGRSLFLGPGRLFPVGGALPGGSLLGHGLGL